MAAAIAATPRLFLQKRGHILNHARYRRSVVAASSGATDDGGGSGDDDDGGEQSRLLRHVKALLSADDVACKQILSSPEGKALLEMSNHTAALRMVKLRDALPVQDLDVMAMVIEQPSLLTFEGDYDKVGCPKNNQKLLTNKTCIDISNQPERQLGKRTPGNEVPTITVLLMM